MASIRTITLKISLILYAIFFPLTTANVICTSMMSLTLNICGFAGWYLHLFCQYANGSLDGFTHLLFPPLSMQLLKYCTTFSSVCTKSGLISFCSMPFGSTSFSMVSASLPSPSLTLLKYLLVNSIASCPCMIKGVYCSSVPCLNYLSAVMLTSLNAVIDSLNVLAPTPNSVTFCDIMMGLLCIDLFSCQFALFFL